MGRRNSGNAGARKKSIQKPDVNDEIIELFSIYESRNICCSKIFIQKFIATDIAIDIARRGNI